MNENWIFKNSPFEMLSIAFKRLFPNVNYKAYFSTCLKDENGEPICGLTDFRDNGEIIILIEGNLSVYNSIEIFAHELAHAGVGSEHEHDEVWENAFERLYYEYFKIGKEIFGEECEIV